MEGSEASKVPESRGAIPKRTSEDDNKAIEREGDETIVRSQVPEETREVAREEVRGSENLLGVEDIEVEPRESRRRLVSSPPESSPHPKSEFTDDVQQIVKMLMEEYENRLEEESRDVEPLPPSGESRPPIRPSPGSDILSREEHIDLELRESMRRPVRLFSPPSEPLLRPQSKIADEVQDAARAMMAEYDDLSEQLLEKENINPGPPLPRRGSARHPIRDSPSSSSSSSADASRRASRNLFTRRHGLPPSPPEFGGLSRDFWRGVWMSIAWLSRAAIYSIPYVLCLCGVPALLVYILYTRTNLRFGGWITCGFLPKLGAGIRNALHWSTDRLGVPWPLVIRSTSLWSTAINGGWNRVCSIIYSWIEIFAGRWDWISSTIHSWTEAIAGQFEWLNTTWTAVVTLITNVVAWLSNLWSTTVPWWIPSFAFVGTSKKLVSDSWYSTLEHLSTSKVWNIFNTFTWGSVILYFEYITAFVAETALFITAGPMWRPLIVLLSWDTFRAGVLYRAFKNTVRFVSRILHDTFPITNVLKHFWASLKKALDFPEIYSKLSIWWSSSSGTKTSFTIIPESQYDSMSAASSVRGRLLKSTLGEMFAGSRLGEDIRFTRLTAESAGSDLRKMLAGSEFAEVLADLKPGALVKGLRLGESLSGSILGDLLLGSKTQRMRAIKTLAETLTDKKLAKILIGEGTVEALRPQLADTIALNLEVTLKFAYLRDVWQEKRISQEGPSTSWMEDLLGLNIGKILSELSLGEMLRGSKLDNILDTRLKALAQSIPTPATPAGKIKTEFTPPVTLQISPAYMDPILEPATPMLTRIATLMLKPTLPIAALLSNSPSAVNQALDVRATSTLNIPFDPVIVSGIASYILSLLFLFAFTKSLQHYLRSWSQVIGELPLPPDDIPPPAGVPSAEAIRTALPPSPRTPSFSLPLIRLPSISDLLAYTHRTPAYLRRLLIYTHLTFEYIRQQLIQFRNKYIPSILNGFVTIFVNRPLVYFRKILVYTQLAFEYIRRQLIKFRDNYISSALNRHITTAITRAIAYMRWLATEYQDYRFPMPQVPGASLITKTMDWAIHLYEMINRLFADMKLKILALRALVNDSNYVPLQAMFDALAFQYGVLVRVHDLIIRTRDMCIRSLFYVVYIIMGWVSRLFGDRHRRHDVTLRVVRAIRSYLWTSTVSTPRRRGTDRLNRHHFPGFAEGRHRSLPHPQCEYLHQSFIPSQYHIC